MEIQKKQITKCEIHFCVRQAEGGKTSREATDRRVARSYADPEGGTPE
jgi:hypothetical protein